MPSPRTGLVLAAGFGSRLAGAVRETDLKPLTPVAGTPLIARTLASLARGGCDHAVIVLGLDAGTLHAGIEAAYDGPLALTFVINERFAQSNGVSVLAARDHLTETFVLTMADHVGGDAVMDLARRHQPPADGATLLVDFKLDAIFDMDDATKVRVADGRMRALDVGDGFWQDVDTPAMLAHAEAALRADAADHA